MYCAQTLCRTPLNATLRACTFARRVTSAAALDVGLTSIDWQTCAPVHVPTANAFVCRMLQRLKRFGIDETMIRASGRLVVRRFMASVKLVWKLATEVMVASLDVQTSLAPISIRTRSGL